MRDGGGVVTHTYYDKTNRPVLVVRDSSRAPTDETLPDSSEFGNDHYVVSETIYDAGGRAIESRQFLIEDEILTERKSSTYYDGLNRPYLVFRSWDGDANNPSACNRDTTGQGNDQNICAQSLYDPENGFFSRFHFPHQLSISSLCYCLFFYSSSRRARKPAGGKITIPSYSLSSRRRLSPVTR